MLTGRPTFHAQMLYLWALLRRFKLTFVMLAVLVFGGGTVMWAMYEHIGKPITWSRAVFSAYFLLFAQPTMEIPDYTPLEVLSILIPPFGIVTVAEGLVRFAFLFFNGRSAASRRIEFLEPVDHGGGPRVSFFLQRVHYCPLNGRRNL